MAYTDWSVVFGEQPSAAKWNQLGDNDRSFKDGTGIDDGALKRQKIEGYTDLAPFDFVASGLVWTGDSYGSNTNASMTAGVVYLAGKRVTVSAVSARTFTASKDTYVDVDNAGTLYYSEVTNNAASPSLTAGRMRIAIIVTGASNIANAGSINQGQFSALLPVNSNQYYAGFDSGGVPIYNTSATVLRCVRSGISSPVPTTETDIAGIVSTFTLSKPTEVKIYMQSSFQINSGGTRNINLNLYIDNVYKDGIFAQDAPSSPETHYYLSKLYIERLATGTHTIKLRSVSNVSGVTALYGTKFIAEFR